MAENETVFDLAPFLTGGADAMPEEEEVLATCKAMSEYIHRTGILVVRDPRVSSGDNDSFLDLMQRYYSQPEEVLMEDARPEIFYQVGVTPEKIETAVCASDTGCMEAMEAMEPSNRPLRPTGPDPKWRFFWRIGDRPEADQTAFAELNAPPVVPRAFPEWPETMEGWGHKILGAAQTVAEMLALGFGEGKKRYLLYSPWI
jgi:isopenicillin N synthase-like dioxygenase